jgi:hypothetical protein
MRKCEFSRARTKGQKEFNSERDFLSGRECDLLSYHSHAAISDTSCGRAVSPRASTAAYMRVILNSLSYSAMSESGFSKKVKVVRTPCSPYRDAFVQIVTKKNWYAPLGWCASHACNIKRRFIAGTLKDETIEKIVKRIEDA